MTVLAPALCARWVAWRRGVGLAPSGAALAGDRFSPRAGAAANAGTVVVAISPAL